MNFISKIKIPGSETPYILKDSLLTSRVDAIESTVASALTFQGVVGDAATIQGLTDYKKGWTYKANASFELTGLGKVENGDMIICIADFNEEYSFLDWTVVQNNVDTMEGASSTKSGTRGLVPAPAMGDEGKYLRGDGTWANATAGDIEWGDIGSLI